MHALWARGNPPADCLQPSCAQSVLLGLQASGLCLGPGTSSLQASELKVWDKQLPQFQESVLYNKYISTYCCLVTHWCPTLCEPTDCSMTGFPVLHHLLELAQTQDH